MANGSTKCGGYLLGSSLAAALLDGLFEHPAWCTPVVQMCRPIKLRHIRRVSLQPFSDDGRSRSALPPHRLPAGTGRRLLLLPGLSSSWDCAPSSGRVLPASVVGDG